MIGGVSVIKQTETQLSAARRVGHTHTHTHTQAHTHTHTAPHRYR